MLAGKPTKKGVHDCGFFWLMDLTFSIQMKIYAIIGENWLDKNFFIYKWVDILSVKYLNNCVLGTRFGEHFTVQGPGAATMDFAISYSKQSVVRSLGSLQLDANFSFPQSNFRQQLHFFETLGRTRSKKTF